MDHGTHFLIVVKYSSNSLLHSTFRIFRVQKNTIVQFISSEPWLLAWLIFLAHQRRTVYKVLVRTGGLIQYHVKPVKQMILCEIWRHRSEISQLVSGMPTIASRSQQRASSTPAPHQHLSCWSEEIPRRLARPSSRGFSME